MLILPATVRSENLCTHENAHKNQFEVIKADPFFAKLVFKILITHKFDTI